MNQRPKQSRRTGFTLLELSLALAVSALVAGVMFMSLDTAYNTAKGVTDNIDNSRSAELALGYLADDLENAMQPTQSAGTGTSITLVGNFEGTASTDARGNPTSDLIFYTTSYAAQHTDGNGEIKYVELTLERKPTGEQVLVRRVASNLLDPNSISASQGSLTQQGLSTDEEVLCRNVVSFSLQYFTGTDWTTTWDSTIEDNTIPTAVQVTLQLNRPGDETGSRPLTFVRTFPLTCSTAATDTNVNGGGISSP